MAMPTVNLQYPQASQQLQTPYEACLYGSITGSEEFRPVFDRLTLRTENGSSHMHIRELVFQLQLPNNPNNFSYQMPGDGNAPELVCRQDLLDEKKTWIVSTRGRPEPVRLHPIAIVRPAMHARANGDIYGFASTLGFTFQSETYKRGFTFGKGNVTVNVYQLDVHVTETKQWEKAPETATWYIEAKAPPVLAEVSKSVDAVVEIRELLKGLVDLNRDNIVTHK